MPISVSSPAVVRRLAAGSPDRAWAALRGAIVIALAGTIAACLWASGLLRAEVTLLGVFFDADRPALGRAAAVLGLVLIALLARFDAFAGPDGLARRPGIALGVALAVAAALLTWLLHGGFPLSYDEVMAEFDAGIFRSGRLLAPVAPEWRDLVPALAPQFVLPVPGHAAWASTYLPVGAMLRAGFGLVGAERLTGAVLAGLAAWLTVDIARRLWPARPDAALVAGLLLATAPQVLVTATTAYAMSAHLTLNLLWLRLFLRGGRLGHGGAVLVGFLACGLHQAVFHPLFAVPFLVGLVTARRWRLVTFYAGAYALIGLFWAQYWSIAVALSGTATGEGALGGRFLVTRIVEQLASFSGTVADPMAKNLLRFWIWENPLLLPLAALAWPALRRGDGVVRPLAAGLLLTVAAMAVLSPLQGHGWGYRYLHGLIGNACLIAAAGWMAATEGLDREEVRRARGAVMLGGLATVALVLPVLAGNVHRFAAPYVAAARAIGRTDADVVVVDETGIAYARDLVRNAPDLANRPRIVLLGQADAAGLRALCARGSVATFGAAEGRRLGIPEFVSSDRDPQPRVLGPIPCATKPLAID
ncbi:hypothetical protein [Methylobacterium sp. JK268]